MKKLILTLTILSQLIVITTKAQNTNENPIIETQTIANFDSLLNSWYVGNSVNDTKNTDKFTDEHYIDIADSIIIKRLQKIPTSIQLTYNNDVRNWINLYLKRGKYMIPTYMGLSKYYFPMFEAALDAKGMPIELKYLPIIESALNPRAVSRAGATGLWQFMFATGSRYKLEINSYVDQRRDPQASTNAAITYLSDLYKIYQDWNLALAAYNCGAGNVNKAITRSGGKTNFWEIYNYLPRETRGYIPAFIAMTYIMNYTNEHNFNPASIEIPINTDTVTVTDTLHLKQVAEVINIPIKQLRDLNPQFKKDIIPGHIKPYALTLPTEYISQYLINEDKIYKYLDSVIFSKKVIITQKTNRKQYNQRNNYTYTPQKCPEYNLKNKGKVKYTIKPGDTFSFIAGWFDVSIKDIKCWNNLTSNKIVAGQNIIIYKPTRQIPIYQKIDKMTLSQKQNKTSDRTTKQKSLDPDFLYYTIKSGDNIQTIARKFNNVSDNDIIKINNFSNRDIVTLQIGQVIKIKKKN